MLWLVQLLLAFALFAPQLCVAQTVVDVPPSNPPPTPPPPPPSPDRQLYVLTLADGQTLRGYLVAKTKEQITLELVTGGAVTVPAAQVTAIDPDRGTVVNPDGELWFEDPHRTRYFYGPSGFMLRKGQGDFSQKELLFSTVSYGVLDNLSLQVGTVAPAWFFGVQGINGIFAVKVGGRVMSRLNVCGGAQTLFLPFMWGSSGPQFAGLAFGCATVGSPDAHFTVSAGVPFLLNPSASVSSGFITTLSGNLRVGRNIALVTENWFVVPDVSRTQLDAFTANVFGVRFMGQRIAVDLGAMWFVTTRTGLLTPIPIPWLDFTFNFNL